MYLRISLIKSINEPLSEFCIGYILVVAKCGEPIIQPVMGLAIQVHSGKLDGLHLSHGVKLQVSIQLLHPCLCCHLGRTIKVWNLYLPCPSLKLKASPMVHPRPVSELELTILI
jgi:hypothetical protein